MVQLPSSSFFLPIYLTQLITDETYSKEQFTYAVKKGNEAALTLSVDQAIIGSKNWLTLISKLAKKQGEAAYNLGNWYIKRSEKISATQNHQVDLNKANIWFKHAIRLDSVVAKRKAKLALAILYFNKNNYVLAQTLVNSFDESSTSMNVDILILQIHLAIVLGETDVLANKINEGREVLLKSLEGRKLLDDIVKFKIISSEVERSALEKSKNETSKSKESDNINNSIEKHNKASCSSSIQLFATSLKHLEHLEKLQSDFSDKPLAPFICFDEPRYLPKTAIICNGISDKAIQCNESDWELIANTVKSRHIGLMVEKGGANVHLGIMYFDRQDTVEVLSHEISHLLGFVDEYPLVNSHDKCQNPQQAPFSHNIAVLNAIHHGDQNTLRQQLLKQIPWAEHIDNKTPILQKVLGEKNAWLLGTPKNDEERVGVYIAESCDNSIDPNKPNYNAYKSVTTLTQLGYFRSEFPKGYLALLNESPQRFLMPSFHYNMALAFYQQGHISKAKYWLKKAVLWEHIPKRRIIIGQGAY